MNRLTLLLAAGVVAATMSHATTHAGCFSFTCSVLERLRPAAKPAETSPPVEATPDAADAETDTAVDLLNRTRSAKGLYALIEDRELTVQAAVRLADNIRRGHWSHFTRNGKMVRAMPPGCAEGCGNTTSGDRWHTCYVGTTRHKTAGAAMAKMPNGRVWQLLLVR